MKKRLIYVLVLALVAVSALLPAGCEKLEYVNENEVKLEFSVDTVAFDTLFTTIGSTTRQVKVYNRSNRDVVISSVTLADGRQSPFRLTVDGDTSIVARNVEIMAGDSIFIFIQANLHYDTIHLLPFIVEDAIVFGNGQRLPVSAWGRNAVYHRGASGEGIYLIECSGWDHSRPHVILDTAVVYTDSLLALVAGDEVYFADRAALLVYDGGTLTANGSNGQPVLFTSLRSDGWYSFLPGQWAALWFNPGSHGTLDHVLIEKGTFGIIAADTAERNAPMLTISNAEVRYMSYTGMLAQGARVEVDNMLVYQCGTASLLLRGGDYLFSHATFGGYWSYGSRQNGTVVLNNWCFDANGDAVPLALTRAEFSDCIIWGTYSAGEVLEQELEGTTYSSNFIHSIVKGGQWDEDPMFVDVDNNDYHLREGSPAVGIGYQFDN